MESSSRSVIRSLGVLFCFALILGGENGGVAGDGSPRNCGFPAVFNFGDSNSDTGTSSAALGEALFPLGMTVGKKFKRASDGRLIIDFLVENLGLPYLNGSVDSIGTSFKHGANFATSGAKIGRILIPGGPPFNLDVQVSQFLRFKSHTTALYEQASNDGMNPLLKSILPEPDIFSKALYTFDIGQNDLACSYDWSSPRAIVDIFFNATQLLLKEGAKFLWVHNTGPFGCLPKVVLTKCLPGMCPESVDENGCWRASNSQSEEFNKLLKESIENLRKQFPDAAITYVDVFAAKYSLVKDAKKQGFHDPLGFCCGNIKDWCGTRIGHGKVMEHERAEVIATATACNEPAKYISWDGIHYSEAANKIIANLIASGSFSDTKLPISEACHKQ